MINKNTLFAGLTFLYFSIGSIQKQEKDARFISFVADPKSIQLYWKDDKGQIFKSIQNLKSFVEAKNQKLKFAMNGGMYLKDNSPQGIFIENGLRITPLDTASGAGNFYLKPNGVFYLTKSNKAVVCQTKEFVENDQITFATQSGPMLVINGEIHKAFIKGSSNLNIRNGVGILPDNTVLFAMSKQEVNFYDFAEFFKSMGCTNALYLDGFVSRTYLPQENWMQLDGNFGVIIGVTE
ncbi:MAG TPA: phosphodiester glycosidase family protein [Chryseolinea sp.]|nr:phosphodiester glycosidase family protein [Chryseolinea sp.]HPM30468.1 phosphodiester glycosidase family protein [Chryseolinea sp.]